MRSSPPPPPPAVQQVPSFCQRQILLTLETWNNPRFERSQLAYYIITGQERTASSGGEGNNIVVRGAAWKTNMRLNRIKGRPAASRSEI